MDEGPSKAAIRRWQEYFRSAGPSISLQHPTALGSADEKETRDKTAKASQLWFIELLEAFRISSWSFGSCKYCCFEFCLLKDGFHLVCLWVSWRAHTAPAPCAVVIHFSVDGVFVSECFRLLAAFYSRASTRQAASLQRRLPPSETRAIPFTAKQYQSQHVYGVRWRSLWYRDARNCKFLIWSFCFKSDLHFCQFLLKSSISNFLNLSPPPPHTITRS
jgi:hypothetical protein